VGVLVRAHVSISSYHAANFFNRMMRMKNIFSHQGAPHHVVLHEMR
jgi:hypothetical protein